MTQQINRNCKCGFMQSRIIIYHQFKCEFITAFFNQRRANNPRPCLLIKFTTSGSYVGCRNKIAFIFAVFIVNNNYEFAFFNIFNRTFNCIQHLK